MADCAINRTEKLYGHGYEINAIAASHSGQLVASACRSTNAEHAVIRLHRTDTWAQVLPPLAGHALTVTAIRFSPDDRYILSASRDRSWQLFERQEASPDGMAYVRVASTSKAHARIIWDCCWSLDGSMFATAARDKTVKLWRARDAEDRAAKVNCPCIATLQVSDAATAVSFTELDGRYVTGPLAPPLLLADPSPPTGLSWRLVPKQGTSCSSVATVPGSGHRSWSSITSKSWEVIQREQI